MISNTVIKRLATVGRHNLFRDTNGKSCIVAYLNNSMPVRHSVKTVDIAAPMIPYLGINKTFKTIFTIIEYNTVFKRIF
ncbi:hypothetical protein SCALIN_C11_0046 [Candidatus Scalindua japonica]|uniref:Uncharacterized protein n=1 Tax=Candidatus Scalindua japonica TaxID=1284222 RepID=A0A286TX29_9BACT|nr:hypothetical protein SCALIN_C11_0046 [Candidatus Scalindua japonica]